MMNSLEALNISLACQTADVDFLAPSQNGPRRSIVRRIASKLPLAPNKRICINLELIKLRKRSDSGISSPSEDDLLWHTRGLFTLANVPQLIHEKSPPNIWLRCEHRSSLSVSLMSSDSKGSTVNPNRTLPLAQMNSAAANRIMELEIELAKLRQQLTEIVRLQEQGAAAVDFTSVPRGISSLISSELAGGPPPPAPPPPPPFPVTPLISVAQIIQKNKAKSSSRRLMISGNKANVDMTEILRDMGKVKLRQVARSPGGTPLRKNMDSSESNDVASFIASALKRKFAKVKEDSKENQSFSSPDGKSNSWSPINSWSPVTNNNPKPIGPHLLKSRGSVQLKPMMSSLCHLEEVAE